MSIRHLELERHADGKVFVVDPDPLLADPVNGNSAVLAKCKSSEEAREWLRSWKESQNQ